jgi:hypothetical protein
MTTTSKNAKTAALEALIEAHAIELKLPTVRRRFRTLAAEATREQQTPVAYLGALLQAEMAERAERRERRRVAGSRFRNATCASPPTGPASDCARRKSSGAPWKVANSGGDAVGQLAAWVGIRVLQIDFRPAALGAQRGPPGPLG